jgi:hypothetical protein
LYLNERLKITITGRINDKKDSYDGTTSGGSPFNILYFKAGFKKKVQEETDIAQ